MRWSSTINMLFLLAFTVGLGFFRDCVDVRLPSHFPTACLPTGSPRRLPILEVPFEAGQGAPRRASLLLRTLQPRFDQQAQESETQKGAENMMQMGAAA